MAQTRSNTSIVIPLGTGSRWNNQELRSALRSVEKHLTGYGDVFIIGDKPNWLQNVVHIPCPDVGTQCYDKERNIFTKIMAACADERVTEDFLFMNDDHFLLQDYEAVTFPYYCYGWLDEFLTVTNYKYTVKNTIAATEPGDTVYADIHCPIVYNKEKIQRLSQYDWSLKFGYCIKTLYCYHWVEKIYEAADLKIDEVYTADQIRKMIAGRSWFSIGDRARMGGMQKVLDELYPNKSKYEL